MAGNRPSSVYRYTISASPGQELLRCRPVRMRGCSVGATFSVGIPQLARRRRVEGTRTYLYVCYKLK